MTVVSCLMGINRYDQYVPQAIESVLCQTFRDFELIILVNGNADIIDSIQNDFQDPRIKIQYSTIQQLAYNLNKGLEIAQGKYIARMDGDDICDPERFSKQVQILDQREKTILVSSLSDFIDEFGRTIKVHNSEKIGTENSFWYSNPIIHPSVMFRKTEILKVGGYSSSICQDYDLWLRLNRKFSQWFYVIPEPLIKYRIHSQQARGRLEAYGTSAGLILREFLVTKKLKYFLGSIIFIVKTFVRGRA